MTLLILTSLTHGWSNRPETSNEPSAIDVAFAQEQLARKRFLEGVTAWDYTLTPEHAGYAQKIILSMTERIETGLEQQLITEGHPCNTATPRTVQGCAQRALQSNVIATTLAAQSGTKFAIVEVGNDGVLDVDNAQLLGADEVTWLGVGRTLALLNAGYEDDTNPDINLTPFVSSLNEFVAARNVRLEAEGHIDPATALEYMNAD